jgi:hypothetical protein
VWTKYNSWCCSSLLVGGIRVVVLADEAIAGIPSGVGVDTERGDPEVIRGDRDLWS